MTELRFRHTICIDFDGTLVYNEWPAIGEWIPGAVEAVKEMEEAGLHIIVYSCRLNRETPYGKKRDGGEVSEDYYEMRHLLDKAGLHFVQIAFGYTGKPPASVYIDDKAITFNEYAKNEWHNVKGEVIGRYGKHISSQYPPLYYDRPDNQLSFDNPTDEDFLPKWEV